MLGLSVLDICQSIGLCASIFPSPKDTPNTAWALGNNLTCDIQGYVTTVGAIGVPLYLCSLSIYYLCIVKFNIKKKTFRKVEPCLHMASIIYPLFCGIYCLIRQYYNNAGAICYVAPKPIVCEIFPGIDCTRGEGASRDRWILLTCPSMVVFVVIFLIMITLVGTAIAQGRRNGRYSFARSIQREDSGSLRSSLRSIGRVLSFRGSEASNSTPRSRAAFYRQQREVQLQAFFYIGCYILTYGFVWSQSVYMLVAKKPPPFAVLCLSSIFFPLQGAFNILIYCRPHVNSLRRRYPDLFPTWFSAFSKVIRAGGDDKFTPEERQRIILRRASVDNPKTTTSKQSSTTKQSSLDKIEVEVLSKDNRVLGNENGDLVGEPVEMVNFEDREGNTDGSIVGSCWAGKDHLSSEHL